MTTTVEASYTVPITTRYHGPTDHKPSRVIASIPFKHSRKRSRITLTWDPALGVRGNHEKACVALVCELGWYGKWHGGEITNGYIFVCSQREEARDA